MKNSLNMSPNSQENEDSKKRTTKGERHELRRKEIMEVTKKCVIQKGFHATSVATIAEEAGINVGQLYRYFDSKESIMEALILDTLDEHTKFTLNSIEDMLSVEQNKDHPRLAMEVYLESYRNPKIAELCKKADEKMSAHWIKQMSIIYPELNPEQLKEYAELLSMVFFGMTFWGIEKPEDTKKLIKMARKLFYTVATLND